MVKEKKSKKTGKKYLAKAEDKKEKQIDEPSESKKPKSHAFSRESKSVILVLVIALVFVGFALTVNYLRARSNVINYHGVDFVMEKTGSLIFYHTQIPYYSKDPKMNYNFWIRNNPKTLEKKVPFEGELYIRPIIVFNLTDSFECDGDGVIAMANVKQLYEVLGTTFAKDENASCDYNYTDPRYVYVNIQPGEKTWIQQISKACYTMYVKDCEILPATERYMTETFVLMKDYKK